MGRKKPTVFLRQAASSMPGKKGRRGRDEEEERNCCRCLRALTEGRGGLRKKSLPLLLLCERERKERERIN